MQAGSAVVPISTSTMVRERRGLDIGNRTSLQETRLRPQACPPKRAQADWR
jgi:hypothetical protein